MTKLAVSIMVASLDQGLAAAAMAAEQGADLVEYRLDRFAPLGKGAVSAAGGSSSDEARRLADVTRLVEQSPLPCIITCRPTWEGGEFDGDENARLAVFEHACAGARRPAYLDIELAAWQRSSQWRHRVSQWVDHPGQVQPTSTGLILSTHDFEGRPADLYQRIEAMAQAGACRVIKVAWRARSLRDNLEAFEVLSQPHKPTIALCMGEEGLPSRVLARKFGAMLSFVAVEEGGGTAPGQPTLQQIKTLYRWDRLDAGTRVYGVIGYPVGHSMSPAIHNAGFDALSQPDQPEAVGGGSEAGGAINAVYLPMPIPPEYEHFKATVSTWLEHPGLHFGGASVTIPHKENLLRFVRERRDRRDEIEPLAARIGAANTLTVRPDGSLYVSNSDYAAALDAVCDGLGMKWSELHGLRVAVVGAGGAARAIVAGFAHHGATVVIYNRTHQRAEELAREFNAPEGDAGLGGGKVVAARFEKLCDSCCQVFINCTPVGMHPHVDATPMPLELMIGGGKGWGPGTVVFDTIYNPINTRLLREARAAGCVTIPGTEMFVRQAAAQFKLWTGREAPMDVFRRVLIDKLSRH